MPWRATSDLPRGRRGRSGERRPAGRLPDPSGCPGGDSRPRPSFRSPAKPRADPAPRPARALADHRLAPRTRRGAVAAASNDTPPAFGTGGREASRLTAASAWGVADGTRPRAEPGLGQPAGGAVLRGEPRRGWRGSVGGGSGSGEAGDAGWDVGGGRCGPGGWLRGCRRRRCGSPTDPAARTSRVRPGRGAARTAGSSSPATWGHQPTRERHDARHTQSPGRRSAGSSIRRPAGSGRCGWLG